MNTETKIPNCADLGIGQKKGELFIEYTLDISTGIVQVRVINPTEDIGDLPGGYFDTILCICEGTRHPDQEGVRFELAPKKVTRWHNGLITTITKCSCGALEPIIACLGWADRFSLLAKFVKAGTDYEVRHWLEKKCNQAI